MDRSDKHEQQPMDPVGTSVRGRYPLHRSLTVWSGLLGLSFLAWAWADSLKSQASLRWGSWSFFHVRSEIAVSHTIGPQWVRPDGPWPDFAWKPYPPGREIRAELRPLNWRPRDASGHFSMFGGYSSLMCLGVIGWTLALYGRWRKRRRQAAVVEKISGQ